MNFHLGERSDSTGILRIVKSRNMTASVRESGKNFWGGGERKNDDNKKRVKVKERARGGAITFLGELSNAINIPSAFGTVG